MRQIRKNAHHRQANARDIRCLGNLRVDRQQIVVAIVLNGETGQIYGRRGADRRSRKLRRERLPGIAEIGGREVMELGYVEALIAQGLRHDRRVGRHGLQHVATIARLADHERVTRRRLGVGLRDEGEDRRENEAGATRR
jgi:hypothetical protein